MRGKPRHLRRGGCQLIQLDHANPTVGGLDNVVANYRLDVAPKQRLALGVGAVVAVVVAVAVIRELVN